MFKNFLAPLRSFYYLRDSDKVRFALAIVTTRTESTVVAQKIQYIEGDLGLVLKMIGKNNW